MGLLVLLAGFREDLLARMKDGSPVSTLLNRIDELQHSIERLGLWSAVPLQAHLLLELANIRRVETGTRRWDIRGECNTVAYRSGRP